MQYGTNLKSIDKQLALILIYTLKREEMMQCKLHTGPDFLTATFLTNVTPNYLL